MISRLSRSITTFPLYLRRRILKSSIINSTLFPAMPRSVRWALRKAYFLPYDMLERASGIYDDLVPPRSWIYDGGVEEFKRNGEVVVHRQLVGIGGLRATDIVLDVGCGIGRQAVALTQFLTYPGRYDGIDIVAHGISWCRTQISSRYPSFQFYYSDIFNKEYNPKGKIRAKDYRFPFADATYNFIFLTSVFTHMLPEDVENYVAEIARVLKVDGRCFATFFLLNEESRRLMAEGQSVLDYKHDCGVYRVVSTQVPELSVAYDEAFVLQLFRKYGLGLSRPIFYGGWDGRNGGTPHLGQQDILVTHRLDPLALRD